MKKLKILYWFILALIPILLINFSSCKKNISPSPKVKAVCTIEKMNSYIPSKNYAVLKKRIDNLRAVAKNFKD